MNVIKHAIAGLEAAHAQWERDGFYHRTPWWMALDWNDKDAVRAVRAKERLEVPDIIIRRLLRMEARRLKRPFVVAEGGVNRQRSWKPVGFSMVLVYPRRKSTSLVTNALSLVAKDWPGHAELKPGVYPARYAGARVAHFEFFGYEGEKMWDSIADMLRNDADLRKAMKFGPPSAELEQLAA